MSVSWLVRDTFEFPLPLNNISVQQSSLMTPLPESKDGNDSGVNEGLNAQAMYMKA